MTFSEFQTAARSTAIYPTEGAAYIYPVLGLTSEAGEVAQIVKKMIRDSQSHASEETLEKISSELGDVLWYVSQVATEFKLDLGSIADQNLKKLASRMERGVIGGSGDNR